MSLFLGCFKGTWDEIYSPRSRDICTLILVAPSQNIR